MDRFFADFLPLIFFGLKYSAILAVAGVGLTIYYYKVEKQVTVQQTSFGVWFVMFFAMGFLFTFDFLQALVSGLFGAIGIMGGAWASSKYLEQATINDFSANEYHEAEAQKLDGGRDGDEEKKSIWDQVKDYLGLEPQELIFIKRILLIVYSCIALAVGVLAYIYYWR